MKDVRQRYLENIQHVFSRFKITDLMKAKVIAALPAWQGGKVLLSGRCGTGKSTLVQALFDRFFSGFEDDMARVRFHQELYDQDFLYWIDFFKEPGKVTPRRVLRQGYRYFNEIPRANAASQNALLSFMAERQVTYQDHEFEVHPGLDIFDRNPKAFGSEDLVPALMDRIDIEIIIPADGFLRFAPPPPPTAPLTKRELEAVWTQVDNVRIEQPVWLYGRMLGRYPVSCVFKRSEADFDFQTHCQDCPHNAEMCRSLRDVPGERGIQSMERLARILAWLNRRNCVEIADLEAAFPFAYGHRLDRYESARRQWLNSQVYLNGFVLQERIAQKRKSWLQAIDAYLAEDLKTVEKIAQNEKDLVIGWLSKQAEPAVGEINWVELMDQERGERYACEY